MHECPECYTMCDCDGEDLDQPAPSGHVCINESCGRDDDSDDDFTDELAAGPSAATDKEGE